jgi:hypothetical protein
MSARSRRFFWGNSLAQAVMSAARHHGVDPAELAFRVYEKRHGFVRHPRSVVIEVDPVAPRRPAGGSAPPPESAPARPAKTARPVTPQAHASARREPARSPGRAPGRASERAAPPLRAGAGTPRGAEGEGWDAPDEDSVLAAVEAAGRLVRLAGLDLEARVERLPDHLGVELVGADVAEVVARGLPLLEELELLLPRAAQGLSGRMVRCHLECGGLRARRERELRALARSEAERVLESGEAQLLDPLPPGERRVVHLELAGRPGIATESIGVGYLKRVRIAPVS